MLVWLLTIIVSYMPKWGKNVHLLSTKYREPAVSNWELQAPTGVEGKPPTGSLIQSPGCLGIQCLCPVEKSVHPEWESSKTYKRRVFLEELGHMLVTPAIARRPCPPRSTAAVAIVAGIQQSGSECDPQPTSKMRRRWRTVHLQEKNGNHLLQLWKMCLQGPLDCGLHILPPSSMHTHAHAYTHTHTHWNTLFNVLSHTHTHTHTHTDTHTRTHLHMLLLFFCSL